MRKRIIRISLVAIFALAAALWLSSAPGPGAAQPVPVDRTIDDIFAQMAGDAPGFGGMFFDGETLKVFLKDPSPEKTAALERQLAAFFADDARFQPGKLQILPAQYDFSQLKDWYDRMRLVVPSVPGVVMTDIDDANNRIRIGVETAEAQEVVERRLAELGIPREAVDIEVVAEPRELLSSLRTRHRPLVGGLQIIGDFPFTSECTLGFNARRAGVEGFVTASHCSQYTAFLDGTGFYQPTIVSGNLAGVETVDPPTFTGGACPPGKQCRYSDADFSTLAGGVSSNRGKIARTALGSYAWNGTDVYRVSSSMPNAIVGEGVQKVGRTTGRTFGLITGLCVDGPAGGIWWLCFNTASFTAAGGDSGAPVFRITNSPATNDVQLYGVVQSAQGTTVFYSTMNEMMRSSELGIMLACDPALGLNC